MRERRCHPAARSRSGTACALLGVIACLAFGCESDQDLYPGMSEQDRGIQISELPGPATETVAVIEEPPAELIANRIVVSRLVFIRPAEQALLALELVDSGDLPPELVRRWTANGMGIGWLDRNRLPLFNANLSTPLRQGRIAIINPLSYQPVSTVARIAEPHRIPYVQGNGTTRHVTIVGGEYQMLMRLVAPLDTTAGPTMIDILPHHHTTQPSLLPVPPEDRVLEGTSFRAIEVLEPIDHDRSLVIWPTSLSDIEPFEPRPAGEGADGEGPAPPTPRPPVPVNKTPENLGEAMLGGRSGEWPILTVLIVNVERVAVPTPGETPPEPDEAEPAE